MKVEYFIAGLLTVLLLAAVITPSSRYKHQVEQGCEAYTMAQKQNVPIGCYEYFGIK